MSLRTYGMSDDHGPCLTLSALVALLLRFDAVAMGAKWCVRAPSAALESYADHGHFDVDGGPLEAG